MSKRHCTQETFTNIISHADTKMNNYTTTCIHAQTLAYITALICICIGQHKLHQEWVAVTEKQTLKLCQEGSVPFRLLSYY